MLHIIAPSTSLRPSHNACNARRLRANAMKSQHKIARGPHHAIKISAHDLFLLGADTA
jgi:hypothetical protein